MPSVHSLDHLVLTVQDLKATKEFYHNVLGMEVEAFHPADGSTRWALKFGAQKINLHLAEHEFDPKAAKPTPGAADLCFLSEAQIPEWETHFKDLGVSIEEGPIRRTGATGPIMSVYVRDPDGNLIEISNLV